MRQISVLTFLLNKYYTNINIHVRSVLLINNTTFSVGIKRTKGIGRYSRPLEVNHNTNCVFYS